jgi:hypothetical protein
MEFLGNITKSIFEGCLRLLLCKSESPVRGPSFSFNELGISGKVAGSSYDVIASAIFPFVSTYVPPFLL